MCEVTIRNQGICLGRGEAGMRELQLDFNLSKIINVLNVLEILRRAILTIGRRCRSGHSLFY
jgi:hypothetical protein